MKLGLRTAAAAVALLLVRPAFARPQDNNNPNQETPTPTPTTTAPTTPTPPPTTSPTEAPSSTTPSTTPSTNGNTLQINPYAVLVGGLKFDTYIEKAAEHKDARISTIAMSQFGLKGSFAFLQFHSELMANAGVALHGTSAFEGQAALQVRQQLVRIASRPFMVEAGRVLDEASLDYYSAHVQDTLLQDTAVRDPLLYSGANLGNGVRGTFEIVPDYLRVGLTFNAGNPVANTASLMVGGSFPPFERFYTQPYQQVSQVPNNFPDDTFHMMVWTPSVLLTTPYIDVRAAGQIFNVNTNTQSHDDDNINGYNLRVTLRGKIANGMIVPFVNGALTLNDTVNPTNVAQRSPDRYKSRVFGGGLDVNYQHRFTCAYDCADGIGLQYEQVQFQTGNGPVTGLRYINVGTTYWLIDRLALGARFAFWTQEKDGDETIGERSGVVTLRAVFQ